MSIFATSYQIGVLCNRNLNSEGEHLHTKHMPDHKGVLEYLFDLYVFIDQQTFWIFKLTFKVLINLSKALIFLVNNLLLKNSKNTQ